MRTSRVSFEGRKGLAHCRAVLLLSSVLMLWLVPTGGAEDMPSQFSEYELRLGQDAELQTIANARLRLATAELFPKVNIGTDWVLEGSIKYSPDVTAADPNSFAKKDPSSIGIEASWRLFDGFQNLNNIRAARESVAFARQASLDTRQKLLLEKAERALAISRDRAIVRALSDAVKRRSDAYAVSQKLLKDGAVTISQTEIAAAELQGAKFAREQAIGLLEVSELEYTKFTGSQLPSDAALEVPIEKMPGSAAEAAIRAQGLSPQLKMAFHLEQEAEYKARVAAGRFLPTINLVGRQTRTFDPSPVVDRLDNSAILIRATFPLFDPTIAPALDLARAEARQRRYDRQDASLSLGVEARKQQQLFISLSTQMESLRRQVDGAKAAANAVRKEIETGERTVTDLLDAQQTLLSASVNYADIRQARAVAAFRLLATTGELDEQDLERM